MRSILIFSFGSLFLLACNRPIEQSDQKNYSPKIIKSTEAEVQENCVKVDTNKVYSGQNFYQLIPSTDSTSRIRWGNKNSTFTSSKAFENWILSEKIWLDWSNNKFIVLAFDMGSDSWYNVVLPFSKGREPEFFWRPVAFDRDNGIIVSAYGIAPDSILLATDVLTKKIQTIGKGWKHCSEAHGPHLCLDSINIENKQLYVKWLGDVKRIKLTL